jgi:HD-GYP domain-containing protein (c-di-GMP phosphodiesterase class II)
VGAYAEFLATRLQRPAREIARARRAGMLHDLGKLKVPVAILDKPGKPAPGEWAQIREHPVRGAELAEAAGVEAPVILGVRGHHERWDGKGYPLGLSREAIPLIARIVSVADVWDAVTTDRSYQKARPFGEAMKVLRDAAGSQLDPALVDLFLADEAALKRLHDGLRMP